MGKRTFPAWAATFIFCMLFWLLLTWSIAPKSLIMGCVASAVIAWFSCRFFIHSRPFFFFHPVRLGKLLYYCLVIFPVEVVKANLSMVSIVFHPKLKGCKPGIIRIPAADEIRSSYALAMVSNSITLTPGTITLDVAEDAEGHNYYYVHWIDVAETDRVKAGEIIKGTMEKWIGRIWA